MEPVFIKMRIAVRLRYRQNYKSRPAKLRYHRRTSVRVEESVPRRICSHSAQNASTLLRPWPYELRVVGRIQGCDPPNADDRSITFGGTRPWFRPCPRLLYSSIFNKGRRMRRGTMRIGRVDALRKLSASFHGLNGSDPLG